MAKLSLRRPRRQHPQVEMPLPEDRPRTPEPTVRVAPEQDKPPILDVLPYQLRIDAYPDRCPCRHCAPHLTDAQRAAHERVERDWSATRKVWCEVHGYRLLDLIKAEASLRNPRGQGPRRAMTTASEADATAGR